MNLYAKREPAANLPMPGRLQAFNRLVIQYQEETYALAFDLVGDESQASKIVEEAFIDEYGRKNAGQPNFRLEVLRRVIQGCLSRRPVLPCPQFFEQCTAQLTNDEKMACILVDCLELSYREAGTVLGKTPQTIRKILAAARYKIIVEPIGKENG